MNKLEKIILDLNILNKNNKEVQDDYKIKKSRLENEIKKIYGRRDIKTYSFKSGESTYFKATIVKQKKVNFNVDMIQQIVDKEVFNEICDKKYELIDYEGLAEYVKSLGGSPKEFKSFVKCTKTINNNKLNQLSELGDISLDDLEGCYTVSENEGYIRITESEEEIVDDE
jgi:hypothetical protein